MKHGPCLSVQPRNRVRGDSTWKVTQTGYVQCWETQLGHKTETEQISFTHHVLKTPKSSPGPQLTFHVPETGAQDFSRPNIAAFFNSPLHDNSPFWCPSPNTKLPISLLMCWVRTKHQEIILNQPYQHWGLICQLLAWSGRYLSINANWDHKALWATGSYLYILEQMEEVPTFYFTERKSGCAGGKWAAH